jgi:hypothetical protein
MSLPHVTAIFIGFLTLLSCSSTPRSDIILHEGPEGGVYLEFLPDRKLRAAQPIKLDRGLVARILNGIQVGEPKTAVKPEWVFSDEDTAFLAPLISSALSRATADQQIRFRVVHLVSPIAHPSGGDTGIDSSTPQTGGLQKETIAGTLFAYGRSLYVTLDEYRHRVVKPNVIGEPNHYPDPSGLKEREVKFVPQSALRPDSYKHLDGNTLVIDYDTLAKRPLAELVPASTSTEARTYAEDQPIMPPSISSEPIKLAETLSGKMMRYGH